MGPASIASSPYAPNNYLYITVTVCQPGTATCVAVDHVQVSTATTGLRVLQSALTGLTLTPEADPNASGNTLAECYQLPQGTAWGDIATADIQIGDEKAAGVPIHILATPGATPAATCVDLGFIHGDTAAGVQELGANGVIGLGTLPQDCVGGVCASQYFTCQTSAGGVVNCQQNVSAAPPAIAQVTNPVTMFAKDKNGVIITLPAVDPAAGAPSGLTGSITFGIGTQANNAYNAAATALAAGPNRGAVTTTYTSQAAGSSPVQYLSLFDTGAVAYLFTDNGIKPMCTMSGLTAFYCPATPLNLGATVTGIGGVGSAKVAFTVANAETLSSANPNSIAFSSLGATPPDGVGEPFIWGLPFFFGRTVFIAYPGASIAGSGGAMLAGPFYAF
jgi:Protein of unknown function (DUF3443)